MIFKLFPYFIKKNRIISYYFDLETLNVIDVKYRFNLRKKREISELWKFENTEIHNLYNFYNQAVIESCLCSFLECFEMSTFEISFPYRINHTIYKVTQSINPIKYSLYEPAKKLHYKCCYKKSNDFEVTIKLFNKKYNQDIINLIFKEYFIKTSEGIFLSKNDFNLIYKYFSSSSVIIE